MGEFGENCRASNMIRQILSACLLICSISSAPQGDFSGLPVLFQFSHPTHNVAVFRGADLKNAIAAGVVKGFGSLDADDDSNAAADDDQEDREGRSDDGEEDDGSSYAAPVTTEAPTPTTSPAYVAPETVAPYTAAPVEYKYKPVTYKPVVVYKPAPVYAPAPSYAEPSYADVPAVYTWEYAVKDDYSNNDFGAKESRDGYLTNGKYYVSLPDGRLQTVTYTVDGYNGYVPVVEYVGEAQYPDAPAPSYS